MFAVYEDEKARRRVSTLLGLVTALVPQLLAKSLRPLWIVAVVFMQGTLLVCRDARFFVPICRWLSRFFTLMSICSSICLLGVVFFFGWWRLGGARMNGRFQSLCARKCKKFCQLSPFLDKLESFLGCCILGLAVVNFQKSS